MEFSVIDIIGEQSKLGVQMPNIVMFANCQHDIICQCKWIFEVHVMICLQYDI
jgi:hypothetical protein